MHYQKRHGLGEYEELNQKYSKIITTNPVPSAKSRLVQHDETFPGFQYIEISAATWERLIPYECLAAMAGV